MNPMLNRSRYVQADSEFVPGMNQMCETVACDSIHFASSFVRLPISSGDYAVFTRQTLSCVLLRDSNYPRKYVQSFWSLFDSNKRLMKSFHLFILV